MGGALRTFADDDDDLHITLWALYELHYRGFDDVDDHLEWQPELIELRRSLERASSTTLRDRFVALAQTATSPRTSSASSRTMTVRRSPTRATRRRS